MIDMQKIIFLLVLISFCGLSFPQKDNVQELMVQSTPAPVVTKIYSQVVSFTLPKGFVISSAKQEDGSYVQKFRLIAPSPATDLLLNQEIYLLGMRGIFKTDDSIQSIVNLLKKITKTQCVDTFAVDDVGKTNTATGQSAFVFMAGCGFRKPIENSEKDKKMSMFVVIQGKDDMYVFQWIESSSSAAMPSLSWPVWRKRLEELMPFSLQEL